MRFITIIAVLVAASCQPVLARFRFGERICITKYNTKSTAHVPTRYLGTTVTFTITARYTTTPTVTITPTRVIHKTITTTATTTLPQLTDTFTAIQTNTATATSVVTSVVPSVETDTVTITTTETLTASVSSAFLPFASEPAVIAAGGGTTGPSGGTSKRGAKRLQYMRRGLDLLNRGLSKFSTPRSKPQYPSEVNCYIYAVRVIRKVITVTARHTKTRTARTVTRTNTQTVGVTVSVTPPDASVTVTDTTVVTVTDTATVLVTSVSTTTATSAVAGATVTYYPQCQSNNLVGYVGGSPLYYLAMGAGTTPQLATTPDAETCCELCANTANCAGFSGPMAGFTDCYIFGTTTCDASVDDWTVYKANGQTSDFSVVGNGNCGQGAYGGAL